MQLQVTRVKVFALKEPMASGEGQSPTPDSQSGVARAAVRGDPRVGSGEAKDAQPQWVRRVFRKGQGKGDSEK